MSKDRFIWRAGEVSVSQCVYCVHNQGEAKCAAFPGGIPQPILSNEHGHREPYPGDHGIRFEDDGSRSES